LSHFHCFYVFCFCFGISFSLIFDELLCFFRTSGRIEENTRVFDVVIRVASIIPERASRIMEPLNDEEDELSSINKISEFDVEIEKTLKEINKSVSKRNYLNAFANHPVDTIDISVQNCQDNLNVCCFFTLI